MHSAIGKTKPCPYTGHRKNADVHSLLSDTWMVYSYHHHTSNEEFSLNIG